MLYIYIYICVRYIYFQDDASARADKVFVVHATSQRKQTFRNVWVPVAPGTVLLRRCFSLLQLPAPQLPALRFRRPALPLELRPLAGRSPQSAASGQRLAKVSPKPCQRYLFTVAKLDAFACLAIVNLAVV